MSLMMMRVGGHHLEDAIDHGLSLPATSTTTATAAATTAMNDSVFSQQIILFAPLINPFLSSQCPPG